jgi:hypothetical protein
MFNLTQEIKNARGFWDQIPEIVPIPLQWIVMCLFKIYVYFILEPIYDKVFKKGPWWLWGYEGRDYFDICNDLTGKKAGSDFWRNVDRDTCEELMIKQFTQVVDIIHLLIKLFLYFIFIRWFLKRIREGSITAYEASYRRLMRTTRREIETIKRLSTPSPPLNQKQTPK